eukprot:3285617-Amphidinium_carterae.1
MLDDTAGSTTQEMYDHWILGLNTWLAISASMEDKTHAIRGCARYFFDEGIVSKSAPRTESDTWRMHVLKKARCWAREISNHAEGNLSFPPGMKKLTRRSLKSNVTPRSAVR